MKNILNISQTILAIALISLVLLTTKEGWSGSNLAAPIKKRGLEKILSWATAFFVAVFIILSFARLYFFSR